MPELEQFPYHDRDALLEKVFETAQHYILTEREEVAPTIFLANPTKEQVDFTFVMEFMQSAATKNMLVQLVGNAVANTDIAATVLVTEGWMSSLSQEEYEAVTQSDPGFKPSTDPERQEVLMLVAEDKSGMTIKTYVIAPDRTAVTLLNESTHEFPETVTDSWLEENMPTRFVFFPQHMSQEQREVTRQFNPAMMQGLADELLQRVQGYNESPYGIELSSMEPGQDKSTLKA